MNPCARPVICFTLSLLTCSVHAQSSVSLYGIVDTGVEYVSHTNAAGSGLFRMPSVSGELPSRWGLRGEEALATGYSVLFDLENGFNPRGGDIGQGGRLFGRQAFVGLRSPAGTVAFGRQYTMTFLSLAGAAVLGPDIYGLGALDAYIPSGRADNAVTYMVGLYGFTFGAGYSFGRDSTGTGNSPGQGTCVGSVPGNPVECRDMSAMLVYDSAVFGFATSYEEQRGGANAAANFFDGVPPVSLTNSSSKDSRAHVSGYVKWNDAKLSAGWINRQVVIDSTAIPSARSNLFFIGGAYSLTPALLIDGQLYRIVNPTHDTRASMAALRATYFLSSRTAVYAHVAYLANSTNGRYSVSGGGGGTTPNGGMGQTGVMLGVRTSF